MAGLFEFDIDVDLGEWFAARPQMEEGSRRALMWSMREAGRAIKADGRSSAPVLTGRLRNSIKTSRNIRGAGGDEMSMSVGPMGEEVAPYSKKMQAMYGYMSAGSGEGRAGGALEQALSKVFAPFM